MLLKDGDYKNRKRFVDDYDCKVICLLDLLGMSEFIKRTESDKKICQIYLTINRLINFSFEQSLFGKSYYKDKIAISSLSDSVIISFPLSEIALLLPDVAVFSSAFQNMMICYGLPVRGFITIGKLYHQNNEQVIFGEGLVKAYKYEKDKITSPRVVIDNKLISKFNKYTEDELKLHIERSDIDIETAINKLSSLYTQSELPRLPSSLNIKDILDFNKDILRLRTVTDTIHNDIYDNKPSFLDEEPKTVTIIFDEHKKNLATELKKRGSFKFATADVGKVIKSKIIQFSTEKQEHESIKLKWQYLQAQYNLFISSQSQAM